MEEEGNSAAGSYIFWLILAVMWEVDCDREPGNSQTRENSAGVSLAVLQELRGSQTAYLKKGVQLLVSEQKRGVKDEITGTSLVVQWLRFYAPNTGGMGLIPGWGSKIPHASCHSQKKKKKKIMLKNLSLFSYIASLF